MAAPEETAAGRLSFDGDDDRRDLRQTAECLLNEPGGTEEAQACKVTPMISERIARVAIRASAALLAIAAGGFVVSGMDARGPRPGDLPEATIPVPAYPRSGGPVVKASDLVHGRGASGASPIPGSTSRQQGRSPVSSKPAAEGHEVVTPRVRESLRHANDAARLADERLEHRVQAASVPPTSGSEETSDKEASKPKTDSGDSGSAGAVADAPDVPSTDAGHDKTNAGPPPEATSDEPRREGLRAPAERAGRERRHLAHHSGTRQVGASIARETRDEHDMEDS